MIFKVFYQETLTENTRTRKNTIFIRRSGKRSKSTPTFKR